MVKGPRHHRSPVSLLPAASESRAVSWVSDLISSNVGKPIMLTLPETMREVCGTAVGT